MGFDFERLCKAMFWEKYSKDETWDAVAERNGATAKNYPNPNLIDVVYYGSVEEWCLHQNATSIEALQTKIFELFRRASTNEILTTKVSQGIYPLIYNFCIYASGIDRRGRSRLEAERIAGASWWGDLAKKMLREKTDILFSVEPDAEKYKKSVQKIKEVWGFSDAEIDGIRYFICQTRQENFNPSLNKSLYFWSEKKQTGKTSVARALASVLNGENELIKGSQFESSFNVELQLNDHDLPASCKYNCVILDEAMPKDSRKSYGRVKSMLTSNSVTYNQKFGSIIKVEAKRYYIFTSNDDISEFIQDDSERRLIQIKMDKKPKQISFEKIYQIWLEFAQNCSPEPHYQKWHDTFNHVEGLERRDIDNFKTNIENSLALHKLLEDKEDGQITLRFFEDFLIVGKPTRDERNALKKAVIEVFGEPNGYRWSRTGMLTIFNSFTHKGVLYQAINDNKEELDLPF